jgi:hypothetical protein
MTGFLPAMESELIATMQKLMCQSVCNKVTPFLGREFIRQPNPASSFHLLDRFPKRPIDALAAFLLSQLLHV